MTRTTHAYAPGLMLDLTFPQRDARGVILYLHGGGFLKGARDEPVAAAVAARVLPLGWAAASASYRLSTPLSAFPPAEAAQVRHEAARSARAGVILAPRLTGPAYAAALVDAAAACAALRTGACDARTAGLPLAVIGVSAGGMVALSLRWPPARLAVTPPEVTVAIAAAMLQPWRMTAGGPPALMFHGPRDRIVAPENARSAATRAATLGANLTVIDTGTPGHNAQIPTVLTGADPQGHPWFGRTASLLAAAEAKTP